MSRLQKTGPQSSLEFFFAHKIKTSLGFGCEKGGLYGHEKSRQRRIRTAVTKNESAGTNNTSP